MDKCCFARPWGGLGRWLGHRETLVWPSCPAFSKTTSNRNHVPPGISCNRQKPPSGSTSPAQHRLCSMFWVVMPGWLCFITLLIYKLLQHLEHLKNDYWTPRLQELWHLGSWKMSKCFLKIQTFHLCPSRQCCIARFVDLLIFLEKYLRADRDNGKFTNYSIRKTLINIEYIHEYTWFCRSGNSKRVLLWFPVVGKKHCFESSSWFLKPRSDR